MIILSRFLLMQHEAEKEKQAQAATVQIAKEKKEKADIVHRAIADKKREQCREICDHLEELKKVVQNFDISSPGDLDQLEQRVNDVQVFISISIQ